MRIAKLTYRKGSNDFEWLSLYTENEVTATVCVRDKVVDIVGHPHEVTVNVGCDAIFTVDLVKIVNYDNKPMFSVLPQFPLTEEDYAKRISR